MDPCSKTIMAVSRSPIPVSMGGITSIGDLSPAVASRSSHVAVISQNLGKKIYNVVLLVQ